MLSGAYKIKIEKAGMLCSIYEFPPENLIETILVEKPDLIIMSVIMPHMDGFRATEKIKADERTKNTPLIFVTSVADDESVRKGLKLGAIKYFAKANIVPNDLIEEIKKII